MNSISSSIENKHTNGTKERKKTISRKAAAHWLGGFSEGNSFLTTQSKALEGVVYNRKMRYRDVSVDTTPEELLAAAHAGCFVMFVGVALSKRGYKPSSLLAEAMVSMIDRDIASVHISVTGVIRAITADTFYAVVKEAERNCSISKVLRIPITTTAILSLEEGRF